LNLLGFLCYNTFLLQRKFPFEHKILKIIYWSIDHFLTSVIKNPSLQSFLSTGEFMSMHKPTK
jgi:hypothetical protein